MIEFEKLIYKNILSTGNHPIEINFRNNERMLIIGHNGAGKSTILSAMSFCLFGKDFRGLPKAKIVNSINQKGTYTECHFKVGSDRYIVKRGIKPDIFEISKNGKDLDKEGNSRYHQKLLEDYILKRSFNTFKQIDVLGSNNYVPFMKLDAPKRREMVENMISLTIFADMKEKHKERVSENKIAISSMINSIEMKRKEISVLEEIFANAKKDKEQSEFAIRSKITPLEAENEETLLKIEKLESLSSELQKKVARKSEITDMMPKISSKISFLQSKKKEMGDNLRFFEHTETCPTCTQKMTSSMKSNNVTKISNNIAEIEKQLKDMNEKNEKTLQMYQKICKIEDDLKNAEKTLNTYQGTVSKNKSVIKSLLSEIEDSQTSVDSVSDISEKINAGKADLDSFISKEKQLRLDAEVLAISGSLLKDDGMKSAIIKKNIPFINLKINEYLQSMNFYVQFELDENFKETIRSRYRDVFTYENFSEGEKQRIDLAILFAWRDLAKRRNTSPSNILILDETFDSSMDESGVDDLINILYNFKDTNVIVISHKESTHEKFDRVLQFSKVKNFTEMKEIK